MIHNRRPDQAAGRTIAIRPGVNQWYENTLLSRLDDKVHGAIVVVVQRLHLDDLSGLLLERGGFELLCLTAIAERRETIELGHGRTHTRQIGDVLDPVRALEQQRCRHDASGLQCAIPAEPEFHAGVVYFPEDAAWLGELMAELLGFPGVRHDESRLRQPHPFRHSARAAATQSGGFIDVAAEQAAE